MHVRNVHRRSLGSEASLGQLIDGLGGTDDRLWPGDRWPAMRLEGPLRVGVRGGHGPIRYRVEEYETGRRVRFRFERPRGFHGYHEFQVVARRGHPAELVHVIAARMTGAARLSWPLVFRPLHDALIEDALDNAEAHAKGTLRKSRPWSTYVRASRWLVRKTARR